MSRDEEDSSNRRRKVGHRSPPPEHQFKPGQSGNPLGRPRKSVAPTAPISVDRAYLAEAQRTIRVKDDDGVHELSIINVAIRTQAMAAVKGNLKAQKDFAANTRLAERENLLRNEQLFEAAIEYKALCELRFEHHRRHRIPSPHFDLNPDHLITDANTRTLTLRVAASNLAAATSREFEDVRRGLMPEREILASDLVDQADNVVLRREIDFIETLLQRLGRSR